VTVIYPDVATPNTAALDDLRLFTMPQPGIDRLSFVTWDTIDVAGFRTETIRLEGHYVIERLAPTASDWQAASVDIIMRELDVAGESAQFGRLQASVNEDIGRQSRGQVKPGTVYPERFDSPKLCVMEGFMRFELPDMGLELFNEDVITLRHRITHIPPIGNGGGTGEVAVPLYPVGGGEPLATLREVQTHIGAWLES